ncbi:MAG: hypothetical protein CO021_01630 [Deltaproteobacteria bacterium CG_4_9_14_0_2_um_filter_42_21]|nr:MAG: hypothetical protein CO021_01630 [Deltaproteobacteria bacterium CG_4_9_14_0_2_um_filter_42_21]
MRFFYKAFLFLFLIFPFLGINICFADFNPETDCRSLINISNDYVQKVKVNLENFTSFPLNNDGARVICYNPEHQITITQASDAFEILLENSSSIIIYGLNLKCDSAETIDSLFSLTTNNISFINSHFQNTQGCTTALHVQGSGNVITDSEFFNFNQPIAIEGNKNIVSNSVITRTSESTSPITKAISLSGLGNVILQNSIQNFSTGILANCFREYDNPFLLTNCTIGPGNIITNTNKAIAVPNTSSRVDVSMNIIPAAENNYRIYYNQRTDVPLMPNDLYWFGVSNLESVEDDGGYHFVGKFSSPEQINPDEEFVEFLPERFGINPKRCNIFINNGEKFFLKTLGGHLQAIIGNGDSYYDCGIINLDPQEMFSLLLKKNDGSTSYYFSPVSLSTDLAQFDEHVHCPRLTEPRDYRVYPRFDNERILDEIFSNTDAHTLKFKPFDTLCFEGVEEIDINDSLRFSYFTGQSFEIYNETDKPLIVNRLSLAGANGVNNLLNISGKNIWLTHADLKLQSEGATVITVEGENHKILESNVNHFLSYDPYRSYNPSPPTSELCLSLEGDGHEIKDSIFRYCKGGIFANCDWNETPDEPRPSCAVERSVIDATQEYGVSIPENSNHVLLRSNVFVPHYYEDRIIRVNGNEEIETINTSNMFADRKICENSDDCPVFGKLNEDMCIEEKIIEVYYASFCNENNPISSGRCVKPLTTTLPQRSQSEIINLENSEVLLQKNDCFFSFTVSHEMVHLFSLGPLFYFNTTDGSYNTSTLSSGRAFFTWYTRADSLIGAQPTALPNSALSEDDPQPELANADENPPLQNEEPLPPENNETDAPSSPLGNVTQSPFNSAGGCSLSHSSWKPSLDLAMLLVSLSLLFLLRRKKYV